MALAMIKAAESDGRLKPGGSVVEYTGGSTGTSLAMICAVKHYELHIVSSDAFTKEKLDHMRILGAKLQIIPSDEGKMTETLFRRMIEAASVLQDRTGAFWSNQLNNADQLVGYRSMGDEIWEQTGGKIDAFVQSVGTSACLRGNAESLRRRNHEIKIVAVEPAESPVLSGGKPGAHKIDGIGTGFVPPLWQPDIVDQVETVPTADALAMAIRLALEEGVFAGTSTGANITGALRIADRLGPDATIVTVMVDTGLKYLKHYGANSKRLRGTPFRSVNSNRRRSDL